MPTSKIILLLIIIYQVYFTQMTMMMFMIIEAFDGLEYIPRPISLLQVSNLYYIICKDAYPDRLLDYCTYLIWRARFEYHLPGLMELWLVDDFAIMSSSCISCYLRNAFKINAKMLRLEDDMLIIF